MSREQARAVGLSEDEIDGGIVSARLLPVFRGVFALGNDAIDPAAGMLAASLACGGAVISHRSAAFLLGILDRAPAAVDLIAEGGRGRGVEGVRPHFVPTPWPGESTAVEGIPCTGVSRTLVDLAGLVGESTMRRAVEQAAVLRKLDPATVEESLTRNRRRGAPVLRSILAEWRPHPPDTPVLRSRLEARALALIARHRLPPPICNAVVEVRNKRFEVDMLWADARVVVELDGARFHAHAAASERDKRRDRELLLGGYRVMRFGWGDLEHEPAAFLEAIREAVVR